MWVKPGRVVSGKAGYGTGFRARVAVFGGPAFTFGYAEHVELLTAADAEVVVVDPLRDTTLPEGTAALVLPGGFPEEHVGALADNAGLRAAVAVLAASGAPVHAECGGLLYLCATLDGAPMCDVLPARATMTPRLTLGYRDAVAPSPSPLHPVGARVTGHEFHRCAVTPGRRRARVGLACLTRGFGSTGPAASTPRSCTPIPRATGSRRTLRPRRRTINLADRPGVIKAPRPPVAAARSARLTGS